MPPRFHHRGYDISENALAELGLSAPRKAAKLLQDYQGEVKSGNTFSLDVGPNYAGEIRDIVATLKQVGEMIRAGAGK